MDLLKAMQCFLAVEEQGGFAAAGERLGLSKSMVSKQVAALEEHLGARLLYRTTRRSSLTEAGRRYLDHCRSILEQITGIEDELADHAHEPRGLIRVSAPLSYGRLYLGPHIGAFLKRYPNVRVELVLNDRFVDIVDEGFDLCVRIGGELPASLIARRIGWTVLGFFASPAYLAAQGEPRTVADLKSHRCLVYGQGASPASWTFQGETVNPDWSLFCNNGDLLRQVALAGGGIVRLPEFFVQEDLRKGSLVRLGSEQGLSADQPIRFVYPHRHYLPQKVRVFMDFMVSRLSPA